MSQTVIEFSNYRDDVQQSANNDVLDFPVLLGSLANISYGWINNDQLPTQLREDRVLRTSVDRLYSILDGSLLSPEIGSRSLELTYASPTGSALAARRQFLIFQAIQDRQLRAARDLLPSLRPSTGSYEYFTNRSAKTALRLKVDDRMESFNRHSYGAMTKGGIKVSSEHTQGTGYLKFNKEGGKIAPLYGKDAYGTAAPMGLDYKPASLSITFSNGAINKLARTHATQGGKYHSTRQSPVPMSKIVESLAGTPKHVMKVSSIIRMSPGLTKSEPTSPLSSAMGEIEVRVGTVTAGELYIGTYRIIMKCDFQALATVPLILKEDSVPYDVQKAFIITVIPLDSQEPRFITNANTWLPHNVVTDFARQGTISRITSAGQMIDVEMSKRASLVDPWTQLPLTLRDEAVNLGLAQYNAGTEHKERSMVAITKMGLELEDVVSIRAHMTKSERAETNELISRLLAIFGGVDHRSVSYDKLQGLRADALKYIENNAGPAITHSGKVRTTTSPKAFMGEITDAEAILWRLVLSRLVTTVIKIPGFVNKAPFHMWSSSDLMSMKIPLCVTSSAILVYTCDDVFARLLAAGNQWVNVNSFQYRTSTPKVVGEIYAPLLEASSPMDHTHVLTDADGQSYSTDAIIHDMATLMIEKKLERTRLVVYTPFFCIILTGSTGSTLFDAKLIAGPRASRLVRPFKNATETLRQLNASDVRIHEAAMINAEGYTTALLNYLG